MEFDGYFRVNFVRQPPHFLWWIWNVSVRDLPGYAEDWAADGSGHKRNGGWKNKRKTGI